MTVAARFAIVTLGSMAARATPAGEGLIAHVFETSFTVERAGGRFICVGAAGMDNGPLNAVCREAVAGGWRGLGVTEGQAVAIDNGVLQLAGGPSFDLAAAELWQPPPWPQDWGTGLLQAGLRALAVIASASAPQDGLARVIFGGGHTAGLAAAVRRGALLKTATLADWLAGRLAEPEASDADLQAAARVATHGLMGLGPGLTPSGDDAIAGLLIALHAAGEATAAADLAGFVREAPADATSALSRAFLAAAIEGLPSGTLHAAITALLTGDQATLPAVVDRLDGVGHTSGWDMLAGAVLGLRAVAQQDKAAGEAVGRASVDRDS